MYINLCLEINRDNLKQVKEIIERLRNTNAVNQVFLSYYLQVLNNYFDKLEERAR